MILKAISRLGLLYRRPCFRNVNSTAKSNSNADVLKSLCKNLHINESQAQFLCIKCPFITRLSGSRINELIECVYKLGFHKKELLNQPLIFNLLPITFMYRYQVLQECGFPKIEINHIVAYLTIVKKKTIGELKKSGAISNHINIENQLASQMTQWPTSLTNVVYGDVNKFTLYKLRLKIIQRYLELVLDLTDEEFTRAISTYPTTKHRPLKIINETLKILQTELMIPNHKIKSNMYLIHVDSENLKNILYNFRAIGGIDIKEIIRMHPKLASKNFNTLVEIRKLLQEYEISDDAQRRCFDIYTLGPSTIRERLENAKQLPEFKAFWNHPRFLKMIHYKTTAMKRMKNLYDNNKKCLSLNILSGSSAHYETFEKSPGDRLGKGNDLLFCISQSLGKDYSTRDIRHTLKRHPFWINIPLIQVKYVYEQLSKQFSKTDIFQNCPILLYPWNKIKDTLKHVSNKTLNNNLNDHLDMSKLSDSQKLSIVLYILEKNHYFSGNGVWAEEKTKNIVDLSQYSQLQEIKNVSIAHNLSK